MPKLRLDDILNVVPVASCSKNRQLADGSQKSADRSFDAVVAEEVSES